MDNHTINDVIDKIGQEYFRLSKTCDSDKDYSEHYSFMLLQITANYISLIRLICKTQENSELGLEIEDWFNSDISLFVDDLRKAIYGTKYGDLGPDFLRFILARLTTSTFLMSSLFSLMYGIEFSKSTDPSVITNELIR